MGCGASAERGVIKKGQPESTSRTIGMLPEPPPTVHDQAGQAGVNFGHHWLSSKGDGSWIYCTQWSAATNIAPKGVVVFLHGYFQHTHTYLETELLIPLAEAGFIVFAFDMRGHGRSGVANNAVGIVGPDPDMHCQDYLTVVQHAQDKFPGIPSFVSGYSMGGAQTHHFIAACAESPAVQQLSGGFFFGPGAGDGLNHPALKSLYEFLGRIGLGDETMINQEGRIARAVTAELGLVKNLRGLSVPASEIRSCLQACSFDQDKNHVSFEEFSSVMNHCFRLDLKPQDIVDMSRECDVNQDGKVNIEEFVAAYAHVSDEYLLAELTPRLIDYTYLQAEKFKDPQLQAAVKCPVLLVHGSDDTMNSPVIAQQVFANSRSTDVTECILPGFRHDLLSGTSAEPTRTSVLTWLLSKSSQQDHHFSCSPQMALCSPSINAMSPTMQPMSPTMQPMSPTMQPMSPTMQPMSPTMQPMSPTMQPMSPTMQAASPSIQAVPEPTWEKMMMAPDSEYQAPQGVIIAQASELNQDVLSLYSPHTMVAADPCIHPTPPATMLATSRIMFAPASPIMPGNVY